MFSSPILDLVIALSFTYFMLSLIVSGVHEYIYSVLKSKRADDLKNSIKNLFFDDPSWDALFEKMKDSPHIQSLVSEKGKFPSYIPAKNFAMFIIDQFRSGSNLNDMDGIKTQLQSSNSNTPIGGKVKEMLLSLFEQSENSFEKFQRNIEEHFESAMDRAAGSYKRSLHKKVLVIAAILTILVNADTLRIYKVLWADKQKLSNIADNIGKEVQANQTGTFTIQTINQSKGDSIIFNIQNIDTVVKDPEPGHHLAHKSTEVVLNLQSEGLPLGWSLKEWNELKQSCELYDYKKIMRIVFEKILGLTITIFCLALGAPFWFDLLNKFVNLRAAGKKPEEKK